MNRHKRELVFNIDMNEIVHLQSYRERGGYSGLKKVLAGGVDFGIDEIKKAQLKGRGGAAFPTGSKIEMVRQAEGDEKFIICNADEGEPGTFKDRFIMTHLPFQLIEGITIAAYLAGAHHGYLYIRHEYPEAQKRMRESLSIAEEAGLLGKNILGSGFDLTLEIFSGAGSYLCGEETALLSSIEGKKGRPRLKPPFPTEKGLFGKPTLIQNVETLGNIPAIIDEGADWYRSFGTDNSHGTKLISLSGDVKNRGLFEVPFGVTFYDIIHEYGGGMKSEMPLKAVNIGGASGVLVPPNLLSTKLEWQDCERAGITIGSGAIFVLDASRPILKNVQNRIDFFLWESCGKCTPCREGLRQADALMKKFMSGEALFEDIDTLERYGRTLQAASFCGLGFAAGNSILSSLAHYRGEYESYCDDAIDYKEIAIS